MPVGSAPRALGRMGALGVAVGGAAGGNSQQWQLRYQGGGRYWIVNQATGLVLDGGGHVPSGSVTKQWSGNVQWTFTAV